MDDYQHNKPPDSVPPPPPPGTFPPGNPPYYAPPPSAEMGTAKVVGLSALACCIPLIGPLISLIIGIVERAKRNAVVVIVISAVMLLLSVPILGFYAAIAIPLLLVSAPESVQKGIESQLEKAYISAKDRAKEAEAKASWHNILLSVEHFYVDNGYYPNSMEELIKLGYIDVLPRNPFMDSPMYEVNLSDEPEERAGNFSYLTQSTEGTITGYSLLGFGSINTIDSTYPGGSGPAAVIISFENGEWHLW